MRFTIRKRNAADPDTRVHGLIRFSSPRCWPTRFVQSAPRSCHRGPAFRNGDSLCLTSQTFSNFTFPLTRTIRNKDTRPFFSFSSPVLHKTVVGEIANCRCGKGSSKVFQKLSMLEKESWTRRTPSEPPFLFSRWCKEDIIYTFAERRRNIFPSLFLFSFLFSFFLFSYGTTRGRRSSGLSPSVSYIVRPPRSIRGEEICVNVSTEIGIDR